MAKHLKIFVLLILGFNPNAYSQETIKQFPRLEIVNQNLYQSFDIILEGNKVIREYKEERLNEYLRTSDITESVRVDTQYITVRQEEDKLEVHQYLEVYHSRDMDGIIIYKDHYFLMFADSLLDNTYRKTGQSVGVPCVDRIGSWDTEPEWIFTINDDLTFGLERFYFPPIALGY